MLTLWYVGPPGTGGPMYVADSLRALEVLGPRLVQIYGQGESPMTITVLTAAEHMDDHDGPRLARPGEPQ